MSEDNERIKRKGGIIVRINAQSYEEMELRVTHNSLNRQSQQPKVQYGVGGKGSGLTKQQYSHKTER